MEQGTVNRRQPFRWGARARTLTVDRAQTLIGISGLLAACAYLLVRLAPDVRGKPLHADEAVSGLVAARPLTELWSTVIDERGGPPLHFLAAHLALALDPSADALRWTSVAFALGTVIVCYDLGRRIAGPMAGATAALLAATSTMLGQFGSFGRMYAAFAFTAALAADMFYRALEQRTTRASVVAAIAAALAAATHTYGVFILVAEAATGLALWRGKPLRAGWPVVLVGLLLIPVVLAYLRLSERFSVKVSEGPALTSPRAAARELHVALGGVTGGRVLVVLFAALAVCGVVLIARRQPAFLALWGAVAAPLVLYLLLSGAGAVELSPRHLIFVLPLWVAAVGAGFVLLAGRLPTAVQALLVAGLAIVAAQSQMAAIGDPRGGSRFSAETGRPRALVVPADWLQGHVRPTDVLFDYTTPFLAALGTSRSSVTVSPGPGRLLPRGLERVDYPVSAVVVPIPVVGAEVDRELLRNRLGDEAEISLTPEWLLVRVPGPFETDEELLLAILGTFGAAADAIPDPPERVVTHLRTPFLATCRALALAGAEPAECSSPPRARR